jgi:tetratricopeptide (TPR) repeat protein
MIDYLLAVFLLSGGGPTPDQVNARKWLKDGEKLLEKERPLEAAAAFREAIRLDGRLMMGHYGLGKASMALKDYPAAIGGFKGAREVFLARVAEGLAAGTGENASRSDQLRGLEERTRQEIELTRSSEGGGADPLYDAGPNIREQRAREARIAKREGERAVLEQALREAPRSPEVPVGITLALGSAYFRSGALADAEREYRAALEVQPKLGEARNNLAVVLLLLKRPAEAKQEVETAAKNGFPVQEGLKRDIETALASPPAQ